jgi:CRP-like cAMP-binding protein
MVSRTALLERLRVIPMFSRCSAKDLRTIARQMDVVTMVPGTNVVCAGEHGDEFYVILAGEATVHRNGRLAGRLGPGDYFGELALLDPAPRAATVRASTTLQVATLGHRDFAAALRDLPALGAGLLGSMASQLRDALRPRVIS